MKQSLKSASPNPLYMAAFAWFSVNVFAADGALEIDQACAQWGCLPEDYRTITAPETSWVGVPIKVSPRNVNAATCSFENARIWCIED